MHRRTFLKSSGIGGVFSLLPGVGTASATAKSLLSNTEPIKITKIETVRFNKQMKVAGRGIFWMWIRIHTSNGLIGTGETYPTNEANEGVIKDLNRTLLGANPLEIEYLWDKLFKRNSYHTTGGAEMRMLSAINIALWDILGQVANMPVYQLLGGSYEKSIRIYNTYTNARNINGWKIETDLDKISKFQVNKGIKAIKYCPFDVVGNKNNGEYISKNEIDSCLEGIKIIRDTVGNDLEIGCEFHSKWNLPSAARIANALEPFDILFLEDMLLPDNMQAYKTLASETSISIVNSERLATRFQFREMLEEKATDIAMYDLTWCGGISEGKKISDMTNTYYIPTMLHTAGGPILWYASIHLAAAISNLFYVESVYPNWKDRYPYFFDNTPQVVDGFVKPPNGPGLGLKFKEGIFESKNVMVNTIAEL